MIFVSIVVILITACGKGKKSEILDNQETAEQGLLSLSLGQIEANGMELGHPRENEFVKTITATGHLSALPGNIRTISVQTGGVVKDLSLLPGDRVVAGQILFRLENLLFLQIQEEYLSANAQLKYLQDDFERQKLLATENVSARKVSLKAQSDYLVTKAKAEALMEELTLMHIDPAKLLEGAKLVTSIPVIAPISGYITKVGAQNGSMVNETSPIMEIVEISPLLLDLMVFEKDILSIEQGQEVRFSVPEISGETYLAKVVKTGKSLDENRMVNVHALYHGKNQKALLPGMYVKAGIITGRFKAMALPLTAVIGGDDHSFVLVKTNRETDSWTIGKIEVGTGYQDGNMVEILPGGKLSVSDEVVVKGAFTIIKE